MSTHSNHSGAVARSGAGATAPPRGRRPRVRPAARRLLSCAALVALLAIALGCSAASSMAAAAPGWIIAGFSAPTNYAPGSTNDQYLVTATNIGGGAASSGGTVEITVPSGLEATAISGYEGMSEYGNAMTCSLVESKCSWTSSVPADEALHVKVTVSALPGAPSSVNFGATVTGSGVTASLGEANDPQSPTTISATPASFGLASFSAIVAGEEGKVDTQAGSHPWVAMTSFVLNSYLAGPFESVTPAGNVKDVNVALPAGFVGNPNVMPKCSEANFTPAGDNYAAVCQADTIIGYSQTMLNVYGSVSVHSMPVYNIVPPPGQAAEFGFYVIDVPVRMFVHVRSNGDYGLTTSLENISTGAEVLGSTVTLWGTPADARHDSLRGGASNLEPAPFLTNPTACEGNALPTSISVDSWQEPGKWSNGSVSSPALTGCQLLSFNPSIAVTPTSGRAGTHTGAQISLRVPQNEAAGELATPTVHNVVVKLPAGLSLSPGLAAGLTACTQEESGIGSLGAVSCPASSQIGEVSIVSPLLPGAMSGALYVGAQTSLDPNPYTVYLDAEGYGTAIRLKGVVSADPSTGQLTATFEGNPQLPFSELVLTFPESGKAAFVDPSGCGTYTTTAQVKSWSGASAEQSSSFAISNGAGGASCSAPAKFSPRMVAGTASNRAGGYGSFVFTLSREDGEGTLGSVGVKLPSGLLGMISHVTPCAAAQAAAGTCGAGSEIGQSTISAGPGAEPLWVRGGHVYLTGPYGGGPFGLSIVVPAVAGPFNLGNVVVRAAVHIDPRTAAVSIASDPLPTILDGVPLDIRTVNVTLDRSQFMVNPTDCEATAIGLNATSVAGASSTGSSRYQAADCGALSFAPRMSAFTSAKTSRRNGASLRVVLNMGSGQANLRDVTVVLPRRLVVRNSTLNHACPLTTFDSNPASCESDSRIGTASVSTPVLPVPLSGPVYYVSHGGAKFPEVVAVLQGDGVTIDLHGENSISSRNITTSRFSNLPDVAISRFAMNLPEGPSSALSATGKLCGKGRLSMPTSIAGQNGAQRRHAVKIAVQGCKRAGGTSYTRKAKKRAGARG
jgi:hypothetical protein